MLIVNGNLVADKYIKGGGVYINDGIIEDFGETKVLKKKYRREEYLDAKGKIIMPGMICAHTHFYSAFAIGWLIKEETKNFIEILKKIWWKLDRGLGKEEIILSNAVGCIDAISSGTTTIIDHHSSPNFIKNSLELIAKTTNKFGLRAVLSYEVSDRNGIEKAEEGIKENERAIKNFKGEMTKAIFGIHASFTLSNQTLRKCSEIGKGSGYHIHVAEDMEDVKRSIKNYGMRPVKRLKKYGILGNRTIAAHCIHVNDNDIAILSKTRTNVIHNPESNMNNAVGSMPILKFIGTNACTGLGTDGFTFDMFREMKFAYLLHKHVNRDPRVMDVKKCVEIGIKNNSEIASKFFKRKIGKIEKGAYADLILIDYQPRTPMTSENIYSHIIFGIDCRNVDTTIINGKILMENKKMNIGKEELYAKARECARKLWGRLDEEKPKY